MKRMKKKISLRESMEQLKFENELEKIKLQLEHGAEFIDMTENSIPAEIESKFLKHVKQFEESHKKCKRVQIYDLIGRPDFKRPGDVTEQNVADELGHIREILIDSHVVIDTICDVDDLILYQFIVEELFFEEVDDIRIEGMFHWFIYEEFHPNHDYDIRNICREFVSNLFDKDLEIHSSNFYLADEIFTLNGVVEQSEIIRKLNEFRESYSDMKLVDYEVDSVKIGEEESVLFFTLSNSLTIDGTDEVVNVRGSGSFELVYDFEIWVIRRLSIPGILI